MKFYVSKYDYVTVWEYNTELSEPKELIPQGTIFQVSAMDMMGLVLTPVSKDVKTVGNMVFPPEMLKFGFTETDYIDASFLN